MDYIKVKIYEDGNCFFRCLALHIKKQLQTCNRMKNGRCQSRNLFTKETELANSLRDLILHHISLNKTKYLENNIDGCLTYLEDETFEEHIERMGEDGEFAENLEIKAASDFLQTNILVWVMNKGSLNKIEEKKGYNNTINLLLGEDEHYDYLIIDDSEIYDNLEEDNETKTIKSEDNINTGKFHFVYPLDDREVYCIPYQMKIIDHKNGFLIKHKTKHNDELSKLDTYNCIRIDENHIFFKDDISIIEKVKKILDN